MHTYVYYELIFSYFYKRLFKNLAKFNTKYLVISELCHIFVFEYLKLLNPIVFIFGPNSLV